MQLRPVAERNALTRIHRAGHPGAGDRPARERARDLHHVHLRVAPVHPERVQLHELARVVLVYSALPTAVLRHPGARLFQSLDLLTRHSAAAEQPLPLCGGQR